MSSHNEGHRNHPISFLPKDPITGWILYATRNQPTQVLVCGTGSPGELLFTAIPKQLTKDLTCWFRNRSHSHSLAECFLNLDTLTVWYQIDQCHFAYTAERLVPYLKLWGL